MGGDNSPANFQAIDIVSPSPWTVFHRCAYLDIGGSRVQQVWGAGGTTDVHGRGRTAIDPCTPT